MSSLSPQQRDAIAISNAEKGFNVTRFGGNEPSRPGSGYPPPKQTISSGGASGAAPYLREKLLALAYVQGKLKPEYQTYLSPNFGWNSCTTLADEIVPGSIIRFRIPTYSVGVIVGLTRSAQPIGHSDIEFGIIQSKTKNTQLHYGTYTSAEARVQLILGGQTYLPTEPEVSAGEAALLAAFDAGTAYRADMFPLPLDGFSAFHEFRVFIDRVEYWSLIFDSFPASFEKIYTANIPFAMWKLSTTMFSGGDKVWDVEVIGTAGNGDVRMPKIGVFGTDSLDYSGGSAYLYPFKASGEDYIESAKGDTKFPKISVIGGDEFVRGYSVMPKITAFGFDTLDDSIGIDISVGYARAPKIAAQGFAYDITKASVDAKIPKIKVFGTEAADLTIGDVKVPGPLRIFSNDMPDIRKVRMVEFVYALDGSSAFENYYVVINSKYQVVGLLSATAIETAMMASKISHAGSTLTVSEILQALLASTMTAADVATLTGEVLEVWALHMDVMGSTRYEGYDFNSFANIGGATYGANDKGIFKLQGNTDDGASIKQSVDFGRINFGTNSRKAMPYVYVGMASNGATLLRVKADGQTFDYQVRDNTTGMKAHRFELGRGLRASFYDVSLISESSAFDLHNIEFMPIELQRRL